MSANLTQPSPLGLRKSFGFGDRTGLATPGHIAAARKFDFAPIFAQQSIREMERTGRTPQQVMDDAVWGVFSESWRSGFGADADHLKTTVLGCLRALQKLPDILKDFFHERHARYAA